MKLGALCAGAFGVAALAGGCSTAGNTWINESFEAVDHSENANDIAPAPDVEGGARPIASPVRARTLGGTVATESSYEGAPAGAAPVSLAGGHALGVFRNTYYDFPSEADYDGPKLALPNARCGTIATVPREFFEALCVQGSGTLRKGSTVSFAKRDCECAPVCPKTGQKICFDELDSREFPWGRGATGKAITPLLTVAVDPAVIPIGTAIYVPELDGLPRDAEGTTAHDGCFIAQDRGMSVTGQHIDIFTGHHSLTTLWNRRVPSNRGVTVVVDSPRCARVAP